jgi:hypothetical protein
MNGRSVETGFSARPRDVRGRKVLKTANCAMIGELAVHDMKQAFPDCLKRDSCPLTPSQVAAELPVAAPFYQPMF